jgi:succinate---hydroxymethylglutarate CoA-transferase
MSGRLAPKIRRSFLVVKRHAEKSLTTAPQLSSPYFSHLSEPSISPFVLLQGRAESSTSTTHTKPQGVLSGIKILDLTRVLAGPFCTQILASYGASVVKVEQPGTGDETRQWRTEGEASFWRDSPAKTPISCYFAAVNRNKRSLTLNLKQKKGRNIALQLAKDADVVVNNFLPGKMEELGLGYEVLRVANPGLVYASISGYGATGPDAKRAGYDAVVAAEAGLLHITGESNERPPVKPGVALQICVLGCICMERLWLRY